MDLTFDKNNRNYDLDYSMVFLKAQENYANDLLFSRGHVLLNDILDNLGFGRTAEGAFRGWVKDHGNHISFNTKESGDGVITLSLHPPVDVWAEIAA